MCIDCVHNVLSNIILITKACHRWQTNCQNAFVYHHHWIAPLPLTSLTPNTSQTQPFAFETGASKYLSQRRKWEDFASRRPKKSTKRQAIKIIGEDSVNR